MDCLVKSLFMSVSDTIFNLSVFAPSCLPCDGTVGTPAYPLCLSYCCYKLIQQWHVLFVRGDGKVTPAAYMELIGQSACRMDIDVILGIQQQYQDHIYISNHTALISIPGLVGDGSFDLSQLSKLVQPLILGVYWNPSLFIQPFIQ